MIKRTNKMIALIMSATTVTTLGSSINAFAADALQSKEGDFSTAFAYSNKYLYDGYRGTDGDEQTVYYNNGKYNELEDADSYDNSIKYDNKYIELDNDGDEDLFNLQTGKFEGENIKDQELDIKRNLIKELKDTKRYGNDIGDYLQLGKRISTNKGSFGDVWYQYSADYNYGQATKYITIIDVAANANDDWDNIALKEGGGIESDFGNSYQFWFSVTANESTNKETDGQTKTFNGDVTAASEYIAGRLRDYCGYDAEVITEKGKPVIQIISDEKLDGNVITGHNNDISVVTRKTLAKNIQYVDDGGTSDDTGSIVEANNYISLITQDVNASVTTDAAVQYVTTIDINAITEHQWRNITLEKGDGIESDFGDSYQFWFSITADEPNNKESDGKAKTYNGDVAAASEYIAERIRDYCGYDATVAEKNGKPVIEITSDVQLDGDVILSYDDNISVITEEVSSTDDTIENPDEGSVENPTDDTTENPDEGSIENPTDGTIENPDEDPVEPTTVRHAIVNYDQLPIYYGFVNNNGQYIDISKFANIKLGYTINDETKTANIEEFGEAYGDENVVANLTDIGSDVLTQDSNYIYVSANVDFTSDSDINVAYSDGGNSKKYILRISKALGKKVDGAYTPKEVTAYEMNAESDFRSWTQPKLTDDWYNLETYAKNGNLYVVRFNKDGTNNKIQLNQVMFETKRDDTYGFSRNKITKINDPSIETRMKGTKVTTTDADEIRNLIKPYYSIDSEGNLWALGLKRIYEFSGNGFDEKYTVPAMINNLDVYNKDNLVAWGDNGADYSYVTNINEYTKDNADETSDEDISGGSGNAGNAVNAGIKNDVSNDEVKAKNGWIQTKSGWQFFDESGVQVKNSWIKVNEKWYLINENGIMQTGWANVNGKWYYQYNDGSMATGWVKSGDNWYYLQSDGSMAIGWANTDGNWYYLKQSGEISMGWINDSGNWYHLGTDGSMSIGWLKYSNKWYYLDESGKMLSNTTIDGYKLGNDGALIY